MKRYRHVQLETNRHGKPVVYFRREGRGARIRLPPLDTPDFRIAYQAALEGKPIPHVRNMPVSPIAARKQKTERAIRRCVEAAKHRSAQRGLPHDLSVEWALAQAEAQDFRCALTGIEFFADHEAGSFQNPYAPSFDRIEPALGYIRPNVRIVVYAMNFMLADWGVDVFEMVANSYRYQRRKREHKSRTSDPEIPHLLER